MQTRSDGQSAAVAIENDPVQSESIRAAAGTVKNAMPYHSPAHRRRSQWVSTWSFSARSDCLHGDGIPSHSTIRLRQTELLDLELAAPVGGP